MRGFGVRVKLRFFTLRINFLLGGAERKNLTQRKQTKSGEQRERLNREPNTTAETLRTRIVLDNREGLSGFKILIAGVARAFRAGVQESFYSFDVGGDVHAYGVVHGLYYVHTETVF
jgi:hypothetical protein